MFRQLFDEASDALLVVEFSENIVYANHSATSLTGQAKQTLLSMKLGDLFPKLNGARFESLARSTMSRETSPPFSININTKSAGELPVELSVTNVSLKRRPHLLFAIRDNSVRKQAVDGLQAHNQRLQEDTNFLAHTVAVRSNMIKLLHDVTAHCHEAQHFEDTLEFILCEFCRFDGWCFGHAFRPERTRRHELLEVDAYYEETPGRFKQLRDATCQQRLRQGQWLPGRVWKHRRQEYLSGARMQKELQARFGKTKRLDIKTAAAFPVRLNGDVLAIFEFFSDRHLKPNERILEIMGTIGGQLALVEQRTRTEAALRQSEARLRRLVDSNIAGVFIAQLDGNVTEANPAFLRLLGFDRNDLAVNRLNWRNQLPREYQPELKEILEALHTRRASEPRELQFVRADGSRVPVLVGTAALDSDAIRQIIAFVVDLSEIRRLEKQLLEVSDYEKQRLGQDLHDGLSQQISGIKFQMESLARALRENPACPHAQRAADLVTLLNQAEQSAHELAYGLLPMRKGKTGLAEALEDLSLLMEQLYQRKCVFNMPRPINTPDPQIAMHLYRIAQEAAGNAMKHAEAEQVKISLAQKRKSIVLEIADDGKGMNLDHLSAKSKRLGLHIMRYRAGLIDADLQIQSQPGAGTRVTCEWELLN